MSAILHNVARPDGKSDPPRWLGDPASPSRIAILNGHGDAWEARSAGGAFSVKWAAQGRVIYRCEDDAHLVRPDGLMLLNGGQPYEMAFRGPAETFCVFFSDDLVRVAWNGPAAEFPNLVFRPRFGRMLAQIRGELADADGWPDDLEARLLLILDAAVCAARAHRARRGGPGRSRPRRGRGCWRGWTWRAR